MKSDPIVSLEEANIRSWDLDSGDAVNAYLSGDILKVELKKILTNRRKEVLMDTKNIVLGIDRLLRLLVDCPKSVVYNEEGILEHNFRKA